MGTETRTLNTEKAFYVAGAVAAILVVAGSLTDIVASMVLGGDLTVLPKTAIGRFAQISENPLLGLYNLDLLNMITSLVMVPAFFAVCWAHRQAAPAASTLALIVAVIGTALFVSGNPALPMLELSHKYSAATLEQKNFLSTAGEAILARGEHGSLGVFPGFVISSISTIILSFMMLKGKIFGKACSWCGVIGNSCLLAYLCLVTFVPQTKSAVTAIAAPGGILAIIWLALFAKGLFRAASKTAIIGNFPQHKF